VLKFKGRNLHPLPVPPTDRDRRNYGNVTDGDRRNYGNVTDRDRRF
jgi:hypothetical protein